MKLAFFCSIYSLSREFRFRMNPALVDFVCSLCYYMVYPLCARSRPPWRDRLHMFGWLIHTATSYWILDVWLGSYRSNPLFMVSEDFAGFDSISLGSFLERSYAQVLGGLSGVIIAMIVFGRAPQGEQQQRQLPPERLAVAQVVIFMLFFIVGFNIEADDIPIHWPFKLITRYLNLAANEEYFQWLLIEWVFAFVITVAFEVTGAYEKGIYLNPAHKLAETLINNSIGREDIFRYWFLHIFLGLLSLAMGKTLVQAITMDMFLHQICFGIIIVGLIFRFMNEAMSYITRGHILYYGCPFIVAMISGVVVFEPY